MRQADEVAEDAVSSLIRSNESYARGHQKGMSAAPSRRLAVVTCMDTRIEALQILGLSLGEAHVLRNAGGRVTDDVSRSLALSTHSFGTRHVVLMQHTGCGLAGVSNEELRRTTGAPIDFLPIADHRAALEQDIAALTSLAELSPIELVAGVVYDVDTGRVQELTRWERPQPDPPGP